MGIAHRRGRLVGLGLVFAAALSASCGRAKVDPVPRFDACALRPAPMRRLTAAEYRNTVRDLFSGIQIPSATLVPDERRHGLDNQVSRQGISPLGVGRYHDAARRIAERIRPHAIDLAGCAPEDDSTCGMRFVTRFGRRAFRRPLTPSERDAYAAFFSPSSTRADFATELALAVQAMLESPAFLYRLETETEPLLPFETATRLSYLLWASMPDDALLDAAAEGRLSEPDEIEREVDRMLADPKAREGVLHLLRQWFALDRLDWVKKSPDDGFDAEMREAYRESADRFLWAVFEQGGSLETLLRSEEIFVDERIAGTFGVSRPDRGWEKIRAPKGQRSGILTHPAVLASHGYAHYSSPVLRGVFLLDRMLCMPPTPAPGGFVQPAPRHEANGAPRTNRQAYVEATAGRGCDGCHRTINALGFAFEHFDTMGRFRHDERGLPIDASGEVLGFSFRDANELAEALAGSDRVRSCAVQVFVEYATGGGPLGDDPCFRDDVKRTFAASGDVLRELLRAIATHPKFTGARSRIL